MNHHNRLVMDKIEMVMDHPYKYTSDDVIFNVYTVKNKITVKPKKQKHGMSFFQKVRPACVLHHLPSVTAGVCITMQKERFPFMQSILQNIKSWQKIKR
jgi:hypothetical protein